MLTTAVATNHLRGVRTECLDRLAQLSASPSDGIEHDGGGGVHIVLASHIVGIGILTVSLLSYEEAQLVYLVVERVGIGGER